MPGLPGTGLGGIFYFLLILWIVARESWLGVQRRSSRRRWARIGGFTALLTGILFSFWLFGWIVATIFRDVTFDDASLAVDALAPALAVLPFLILGILVASVQLCRLVVRPTLGQSAQAKTLVVTAAAAVPDQR